MGWKEEMHGGGISEEDITRRLGEAQKAIETEEGPPDFEEITKALTGPETSPIVKEAPPETPGDRSKGESRPFAFDLSSTIDD